MSMPLVVVIAGPTAVGKSLVAAKLCDSLKGMIISADSVQVYKGVQIGANKPNSTELARTPHLLIDIAEHSDSTYNAAEWCRDALYAIKHLLRNGKTIQEDFPSTTVTNIKVTAEMEVPLKHASTDAEEMCAIKSQRISDAVVNARQLRGYGAEESIVPIVVGGTMMYVQWLVHGRPDALKPTEKARAQAEKDVSVYIARNDWDGMVQHVRSKGEIYSNQVNKLSDNDWYRIRRVLEMALTVKDQSQDANSYKIALEQELYNGVRERSLSSYGYDTRCFFLCPSSRMEHSKIIDERCESMISRGLIEETANLLLAGVMPDMVSKAIGYKQTIDYFYRENPKEGDLDAFLEYVANFTAATRQYSKRQMQWFRRDKEFYFVSVPVDTKCTETRIQNVVDEVFRLVSMPREDYDTELLSDTSVSEITRKENEKQGKHMKRYQFVLRYLKPNSDELNAALHKADESTRLLSAKRLNTEELF